MIRPIPCRAALAIVVAAGLSSACMQPSATPAASEWKLVWSDEFDGKAIDRTKWDFDLGNGFYDYESNTWISGWGNGELQNYTREPENAFVKDGMLHIRAVKESLNGFGYTSARLKSRKRDGESLFATKYGKIEFRAKLPIGQGVWSALWMLPQDNKYGEWASSGEIDVLEAKGHEPNKVHGTIHFGSRWPANTEGSKSYDLPAAGTITDFHVYALEWLPGEIRWSVDGQVYSTQSFWWSSSKTDGANGSKPRKESDLNTWPAPFDQRFYIVMNVAVGGKFVGNPNKKTVFPVEMVVDYVRAYEKVGGYGAVRPRGKGRLPFG